MTTPVDTPAPLHGTLRLLNAAAFFLAEKLNTDVEGQDPAGPDAAMADLVLLLARQAQDEYLTEWSRSMISIAQAEGAR